MKTPHLVPALAAFLTVVAVLIGGVNYAQSIERRYVHALASQLVTVDETGSALQIIAFQQPDLLPMYGSSEIANRVAGYEASDIFQKYPTGFAPFEVAQSGVTSIMMAQQLASVGSALQGKKVVISFAPTMFLAKMVGADAYAGVFSRLHANELAFNTRLGFDVKQAAARRMLQYPQTLKNEPVLDFALQMLDQDSPLHRALYYAIWPLGKLQNTILELQDHWQMLTYFATQRNLNPGVPRQPAAIDWQALKARAAQLQIAQADNNPYGFPDDVWANQFHGHLPLKADGSEDKGYINALKNSLEWTDLDTLLRILTELGARPLLLSRPVNGSAWEAMGVSTAARKVYYDTLQAIAAKYGVPVVDYEDHDNDKYFSTDPSSHSSRLGWVYVDQTLDAFYHGILQ